MPDGETSVPQEIQKRMESLGYGVSMKLVCSSDYGVPQRRYRVLIIGIDKQLGKNPFDFNSLMDVVKQSHIPSSLMRNDEKLLLGYVLKGVHEHEDDVVWDYSATTQKTVELIGSCQHGQKAMELFMMAIQNKIYQLSFLKVVHGKIFHTRNSLRVLKDSG